MATYITDETWYADVRLEGQQFFHTCQREAKPGAVVFLGEWGKKTLSSIYYKVGEDMSLEAMTHAEAYGYLVARMEKSA